MPVKKSKMRKPKRAKKKMTKAEREARARRMKIKRDLKRVAAGKITSFSLG